MCAYDPATFDPNLMWPIFSRLVAIPAAVRRSLAADFRDGRFDSALQTIDAARAANEGWARSPDADYVARLAHRGRMEMLVASPDEAAFLTAWQQGIAAGAVDKIGAALIVLATGWRMGELDADMLPGDLPSPAREIVALAVKTMTAKPAPDPTALRKQAKALVETHAAALPPRLVELFPDLIRAFAAMRKSKKGEAAISAPFRKAVDGDMPVALAAFFFSRKPALIDDADIRQSPPTPRFPVTAQLARRLRGARSQQHGNPGEFKFTAFDAHYAEPVIEAARRTEIVPVFRFAGSHREPLAVRARQALQGRDADAMSRMADEIWDEDAILGEADVRELLPLAVAAFNRALADGDMGRAVSGMAILNGLLDIARDADFAEPVLSAAQERQLKAAVKANFAGADLLKQTPHTIEPLAELLDTRQRAARAKQDAVAVREATIIARDALRKADILANPFAADELGIDDRMLAKLRAGAKAAAEWLLEFGEGKDYDEIMDAVRSGAWSPGEVRRLARNATVPAIKLAMELAAYTVDGNYRQAIIEAGKALRRDPQLAPTVIQTAGLALRQSQAPPAQTPANLLQTLFGGGQQKSNGIEARWLEPLVADLLRPESLAHLDLSLAQPFGAALRDGGFAEVFRRWRDGLREKYTEWLQAPLPANAPLLAIAQRISAALGSRRDADHDARIKAARRDLQQAVRPRADAKDFAGVTEDAIRLWEALALLEIIAESFPERAAEVHGWQDTLFGALQHLPASSANNGLYELTQVRRSSDFRHLARFLVRHADVLRQRPLWALIVAQLLLLTDRTEARHWFGIADRGTHGHYLSREWLQLFESMGMALRALDAGPSGIRDLITQAASEIYGGDYGDYGDEPLGPQKLAPRPRKKPKKH